MGDHPLRLGGHQARALDRGDPDGCTGSGARHRLDAQWRWRSGTAAHRRLGLRRERAADRDRVLGVQAASSPAPRSRFRAAGGLLRRSEMRRLPMAALTRFVLSHKRMIVISWAVLTIAGIAAAGPASRALDPEFSVPGGEGWETNVAIAQQYRGTGGNSAPLMPVVTLPGGQTVDSPGVRGQLAAVDRRLERAVPGARSASYASTGDRAFVSRDGRTTYALVYSRPGKNSDFGQNPDAARTARAALVGARVGGQPVHLTGL